MLVRALPADNKLAERQSSNENFNVTQPVSVIELNTAS